MASLQQEVETRSKLLTIIGECNRQLGYEGTRGEHWLNTMELEELAESLILQIPEKGGDTNAITDKGTQGEIPETLQPGEEESRPNQDNSEVL